jgi:hypothetical protein
MFLSQTCRFKKNHNIGRWKRFGESVSAVQSKCNEAGFTRVKCIEAGFTFVECNKACFTSVHTMYTINHVLHM